MGPTDINKQFDNFDKNFDRAWKFVASVLGSAVVTGLIGWVIYHFIHKWW
jgi:hypothetical protein